MGYLFSLLILIAAALPAWGQSDYRNLDPGRPIMIEDAQPIEFRALELQLGIPRYSRHRDKGWELSFEPELEWGFARDWQAGLAGEEAVVRDGESTTSFRDVQLHLLYNFNQEDERLPAMAIRPELTFGAGALGSEQTHVAVKGIVSKTIGLNRVHLNGSYTFGEKEPPGKGSDRLNRYLFGIAYERTLPLEFLVLLADLYAVGPIDGHRREIIYDIGTRIQVAPTWVIDAGLFQALRAERLDFGLTLGVSYVFSFRRLFPETVREIGGES